MDEEQKKKEKYKFPEAAKDFQKGFNKKPDVVGAAKDAWKGITDMFIESAEAKKKKQGY